MNLSLKDFAFSSIAIGYTTLRFFSESELTAAQIGYSISDNGDSLLTEDVGSWKPEWWVIGYEDCCGDPIFVNTSDPYISVYTAVHGIGEWAPVKIADSFEAFEKTLKIVLDISGGRETPVLLEKNPIYESQRRFALDEIQRLSPRSHIEFWGLLFRPY